MFPINHRAVHLMLAAAYLAVALGWVDHAYWMLVVAYSMLGLAKN